jgi:hypothetical protein
MSDIKRVMNEEYLAKISATQVAMQFCLCFDRFKLADAYLRIDAVPAGKGIS